MIAVGTKGDGDGDRHYDGILKSETEVTRYSGYCTGSAGSMGVISSRNKSTMYILRLISVAFIAFIGRGLCNELNQKEKKETKKTPN